MRRLPPLNSIRAFEAAARHESFSRAAAELSVTHGAISKQVAILEDRLGLGLFRRNPGGVVLTDAGRAYQAEIAEALDRIAAATSRVSRQGFPDALDISAPPTFTIQWLVPRLSRFQIRYPLLETRLSTRRESVNVALRSADVVIRRGPETWKGVHSRLVLRETITPVCHPRLSARLRSVSDLRQQVWLHAEARPSDWKTWLDIAGVPELAPKRLSRFDHSALALEAAADGMGIAMGPLSMIGGELHSGVLCMPFPKLVARTPGYYVICRKDRESDAKVRQFCEWLAGEGEAAGGSVGGATAPPRRPSGRSRPPAGR
ncbi:MAG: transcriptional regulator GcvA [Burkholderiales bacterium]|nr:transcriptional regulator GcvA [Burkholderiales bacterium]